MASCMASCIYCTCEKAGKKKKWERNKQDLIAEPGRAKLEEEGGGGQEPEPRVLAMRATCHVV